MPTFEVVDQPEVARLVKFYTGPLNPQVKNEMEFKCYSSKDETNTRKRKMVVTTEVNNFTYSGENVGSSNCFNSDSCNFYLAVYRKKADKIQVLPAELFNLKTQPTEEEAPEETAEEEGSYWDKRNTLISQFGSGSMQRRVKKAVEEKIQEKMVHAVTKSLPKAVTESATASASSSQSTEAGSSSAIPPYNLDATTPADIYPLEHIIPPWVMEKLEEQSEIFINATADQITEWRQKKEHDALVLDLLSNLPISSTDERRQKCVMIMYMGCLITCFKFKHHQYRKTTGLYPDWWKGHVKKLLDESFIKTGVGVNGKKTRSRPQVMQDLMLSHMLVLYMRICDFTILLKPLVSSLKQPMKRLLLYAQLLGFKVKTENKSSEGSVTATLNVPFRFPDVKKHVPKGKR